MVVRICLSGFGKMSRAVMESASASKDAAITSICDPAVTGPINGTPVFSNPREAYQLCDVVIDFSVASATAANAPVAASMGKRLVIGTTALTPKQVDSIAQSITSNATSGVISSNYSLGVNVFLKAAAMLSKALEGYDAELVETHHNQKRDAPSGTALRILTAMGRKNVPTHSLRVGDVPGDHTVVFAGNGERIELTHRATSRNCFAAGALLAAAWVAGKSDGKLHDFRDVIQ